MASSAIEVRVGDSGRIEIPAELQHQLGLKSGDKDYIFTGVNA
ncbi:MAG: hypothetical protein ACFB5Z_15065 [Elainellaceae cyanobacterium]